MGASLSGWQQPEGEGKQPREGVILPIMPVQPDCMVGSSIQLHWQKWWTLNLPHWLKRTVREGLNLTFTSQPRVQEEVVREEEYGGEKRREMRRCMKEMVRERHMKKLSKEELAVRLTSFG